jgi:Predicted pyridoxal phosphate-dependent enzyme apparently involved in regulation of cell wall biogenesis
MAAIMLDIKAGDEVIMPSYTFVSSANAFALRGAKIIFVDIRPDTMNIDENNIYAAITNKTKAIVPVHYAGVGCEMDVIMDIASKNNLVCCGRCCARYDEYIQRKTTWDNWSYWRI